MNREEKMKIVINNYFEKECSVNTSIREAFEKGFRIGVSKVQKKQGEWKLVADDKVNLQSIYKCSECGREVSIYDASTLLNIYPFCHCGAEMK